jgi:putative component of toxin-antitoxin plasmid stabilization module
MQILKKAQTKIFEIWFENLSDNIQDKIADYIDKALCGNFANSKPVGKGSAK